MKNKIVIFGGTSGLSKQVIPDLESNGFHVNALSSTDCDVRDYNNVFNQIKNSDITLYFSVVNYDNLISNLIDEQVNHAIDVNIKGFINVCRASSHLYSEKKYGRLIYISSILSASPIKGTSIYSSSKSFCDTMIKVFAQEYGKNNVTANSIQLGYFDGGLTYKVPENVLETVKKNIPNKRLGLPNELSLMINQIIQNEYLNGSVIKLTGGLN